MVVRIQRTSKRAIRTFKLFTNSEGIDEDTATFLSRASTAENIENMHRDQLGSFTTSRQGYLALTTALEGGARIDGLAEFTDLAGTQFLLVAVNGKIKNINPNNGAEIGDISTIFTAGKVIDSVTFQGEIFITQEGTDPQKWDGTGSMTAAGGFPIGANNLEKPKIVEVHNNRIAYANFEDNTSTLVLSDELDPEVFTLGSVATDGIIIEVNPGDGQEIRALKSINIPNTNETILIIFKDKSIYQLTGFSSDPTSDNTFVLSLLNDEFGAINNQSVAQVGQDLLFMDEESINSLTTTAESGTLQPKIIGFEKIRRTYTDINISQKDKPWAVYLKDRSEVWFALPTGAASENDKIIVLSFSQQQGNVFSLRTQFPSAPTAVLRFNKSLFTGAADGKVNNWFSSSTYDGVAIPYTYQYPFLDLGSIFQNKRVVDLFCWFFVTSDETVNFTYRWRAGGNDTDKTITRTIGPDQALAVYGTVAPPAAVYGVDFYTSSAVLKKVRLPVVGNGQQIQFEISGNTGQTAPIFLGFSGLLEFLDFARDVR